MNKAISLFFLDKAISLFVHRANTHAAWRLPSFLYVYKRIPHKAQLSTLTYNDETSAAAAGLAQQIQYSMYVGAMCHCIHHAIAAASIVPCVAGDSGGTV